jgi:protein TonB
MNAQARSSRLTTTLGVLGVVLFTAAAILLVRQLMPVSAPEQKKMVQQVTLIQPPPPPPPPPVQEPPPPPEMKEEVEQQEPEDMPEEIPDSMSDAPAGDDLGLDADGSGSGDAFGLIGKKGGRGFLEGGVDAWYKGIVQQELRDLLYDRIEQLKAIRYSVRLQIRLHPDGRFTLLAMDGSTGDKEMDVLLRGVLAEGRLREKPPEHLAGLMRVQINSTI